MSEYLKTSFDSEKKTFLFGNLNVLCHTPEEVIVKAFELKGDDHAFWGIKLQMDSNVQFKVKLCKMTDSGLDFSEKKLEFYDGVSRKRFLGCGKYNLRISNKVPKNETLFRRTGKSVLSLSIFQHHEPKVEPCTQFKSIKQPIVSGVNLFEDFHLTKGNSRNDSLIAIIKAATLGLNFQMFKLFLSKTDENGTIHYKCVTYDGWEEIVTSLELATVSKYSGLKWRLNNESLKFHVHLLLAVMAKYSNKIDHFGQKTYEQALETLMGNGYHAPSAPKLLGLCCRTRKINSFSLLHHYFREKGMYSYTRGQVYRARPSSWFVSGGCYDEFGECRKLEGEVLRNVKSLFVIS